MYSKTSQHVKPPSQFTIWLCGTIHKSCHEIVLRASTATPGSFNHRLINNTHCYCYNTVYIYFWTIKSLSSVVPVKLPGFLFKSHQLILWWCCAGLHPNISMPFLDLQYGIQKLPVYSFRSRLFNILLLCYMCILIYARYTHIVIKPMYIITQFWL